MHAMKQPRVTSQVMIILSQYRITGNVHLHPGQRLSDYINGIKEFIPVTQAKVMRLDGDEEIKSMRLLEVNVRHVLLVYPLEGQELPSETEDYEENNVEETDQTNSSPEDDLDSLKALYVDPFKKNS